VAHKPLTISGHFKSRRGNATPKTHIVVPVIGMVPVTVRRARPGLIIDPGTTAQLIRSAPTGE
jgi:hypothetical protein